MSPKLLYLGNPEDLGDGVGNIFARKVMQIPNLLYLGKISKPFSNRNKFEIFKIIDL